MSSTRESHRRCLHAHYDFPTDCRSTALAANLTSTRFYIENGFGNGPHDTLCTGGMRDYVICNGLMHSMHKHTYVVSQEKIKPFTTSMNGKSPMRSKHKVVVSDFEVKKCQHKPPTIPVSHTYPNYGVPVNFKVSLNPKKSIKQYTRALQQYLHENPIVHNEQDTHADAISMQMQKVTKMILTQWENAGHPAPAPKKSIKTPSRKRSVSRSKMRLRSYVEI